ncbi:MAG: sel1 repeat family protein [Acidobacteria bacterium]|nr:sel1 repeat family protein [Acidobacteriota bacterium]MBI3486831.1 sel1 repeat family protein [Acidobacteriota bacterium]
MLRCLIAFTVLMAPSLADTRSRAPGRHVDSLIEAIRPVTEGGRELARAVAWCRRAAEQGDAAAQARLGAMYYLGEGVPRDPREALKWLDSAAKQGEPYAQGCLGLMCAQGDGVPQDGIQAYIWLLRAKQGGNPQAVESLRVVARSLTQAQIEEAKRRASEPLGERNGN